MKKISVIVPIYNGEKYIEKCILSICKQFLKEIEIILINDGSTDNTEEICLKIMKKYKNINYYKIKNSGCAFARNYGIAKSSAEYITFVDADDYVDKEMYFEMYKKAKKDNLDVLICGYKKVDSKYRVLIEVVPKLRNKKTYMDSGTNFFNATWNKIYRRNIIVENNIFFLEDCHMGEDMLFNFKIFSLSNKISIIPNLYYNYFINDNSVTQNPNKRIEVYRAIKEIKKLGIDFNILDDCIMHHGIMHPFSTVESVKENKGDWKEYYKTFLKEIEKFQKDMSFKTKIFLFYRKIRLHLVFLKKFLR